MKTASALLVCLMISMLPATCFGLQEPEPEEVSGKIKWVYDYEQGKVLSETTGRPMFVVIRCER